VDLEPGKDTPNETDAQANSPTSGIESAPLAAGKDAVRGATEKPAQPRRPAARKPAESTPAARKPATPKAPARQAPSRKPTTRTAAPTPTSTPGDGVETPAARKPVARKPAARKPSSPQSAAEQKPAEQKPARQTAAGQKPAQKKAATSAEKTSAEKPKPAARTPSARTAAARTASARTNSSPTAAGSSSSEKVAPAPAPAPAAAAPTSTPAIKPTTRPAKPKVRAAKPLTQAAKPTPGENVLSILGLSKSFDQKRAVDDISLTVSAGSIFGIVGPNGAGKTTTLSMVTGLLRPDAGTITVHGADVWTDPVLAKRNMGVLPDRLRLFDRLTGSQLLYYSGILRGLSDAAVKARSNDLAVAFGLEDALDRLVADYSAGMTKKIALAAAMIHSPRLLVLDEPFESVDPVSAANVIEILQNYTAAGGTVVLSSHGMDLIQRICDSVAVVVDGRLLAFGPVDEVRGVQTLEERFVELAGGRRSAEGMEWLHSFSD
jgi:ABC-2 type transport system ATP-binding protein